MRSEIRLREGRIKPIDVLSKHLNGSDDFDIEINEPYIVFKVIFAFRVLLDLYFSFFASFPRGIPTSSLSFGVWAGQKGFLFCSFCASLSCSLVTSNESQFL